MQNCRSDVEEAHGQSHHTDALLDARPHGDKQARHIVAILEVVLGDDRRSSRVVQMCEGRFYLAEWLDAVIRDDEPALAGAIDQRYTDSPGPEPDSIYC